MTLGHLSSIQNLWIFPGPLRACPVWEPHTDVCIRAWTGGQQSSVKLPFFTLNFFQLHLERGGGLSAHSCYTPTAHHTSVSPPVLGFPHLSPARTNLSPSLPKPLLPLIRSAAVTPWLLDMRLSFILRLQSQVYPSHIARCRMFQCTGGIGLHVSVCPSPPSQLRRWDRRSGVVLRAYSCRLKITDFHCCNCPLITLHSLCVLTCVITYLRDPSYAHIWGSAADLEQGTEWTEGILELPLPA